MNVCFRFLSFNVKINAFQIDDLKPTFIWLLSYAQNNTAARRPPANFSTQAVYFNASFLLRQCRYGLVYICGGLIESTKNAAIGVYGRI